MSVRVGGFGDRVQAELGRARLEARGIDAVVIEPTGFNPMLNDMAGGIVLQVRDGDADAARAILAEPLLDDETDEAEQADVVRCPRCELEYCFFGRPSLAGLAPGAAGSLAALLAAALFRLGSERWRCHKCGHVWDDPTEGPKKRTPPSPGDPRPVFLLRRTSAGMGVFLGAVAGVVGWVVLMPDGLLVLVSAPFAGWLVGRSRNRYVCSEPTCRAPLLQSAERCDHCAGSVAGTIARSGEHFSGVADFRREVAALRPRSTKKRKKRKKLDASDGAGTT